MVMVTPVLGTCEIHWIISGSLSSENCVLGEHFFLKTSKSGDVFIGDYVQAQDQEREIQPPSK